MRTLPFVFRLFTLAIPVALGACSSSYHPEYHPVTVSNFSQNVAYPVAVNNGGTSPPAPVYVMPAPAAPGALPAFVPSPEPPPPDFFR